MILSWLRLASRRLYISFLLASPPTAEAGDFFRQEVLPEEVPCAPQMFEGEHSGEAALAADLIWKVLHGS